MRRNPRMSIGFKILFAVAWLVVCCLFMVGAMYAYAALAPNPSWATR